MISNRMNKYEISLPIWDRTDPKLYFSKLDIIFEINSIQDERDQYAMVISSLGEDATNVMRVLEERAVKYPELRPRSIGTLRSEIIARFSKSRFERIKIALNMPSIKESEMRPSVWLSHLEATTSNLNMDDLKWYILFTKLPTSLLPFLDLKKTAYRAAVQIDHMFTLDGRKLFDL